jgi:hypothetical protein
MALWSIEHEEVPDAIATCGSNSYTNNSMTAYVPDGKLLVQHDDVHLHVKTPNKGKENPSFSKIKELGLIKMTDYEHIKRDISYPVARIRHLVANRAACFSHNPDNQPCNWLNKSFVEQLGFYEEVGQIHHLTESYPHAAVTPPDDESQRVMQNVVDDASSTFDLLTEVAELRETIGGLAGIFKSGARALQSYKDKRDYLLRLYAKNPKKLAKALADLWLSYRYLIMPLIYSAEDIVEQIETHGFKFQTDRSSVTSKGTFPDPQTGVITDTGTYEVRWTATGKSSFNASPLKGLGLNPVRTAWELIPFSFVVDWFINLGNLLANATFALFDVAIERKFCISTRTSIDVRSVLYVQTDGIPARNYGDSYGCTSVGGFAAVDGLWTTATLKHHVEESYVRKVFIPSDIEFNWAPYLDLKRWLDALALSIRPLLKALRRLR